MSDLLWTDERIVLAAGELSEIVNERVVVSQRKTAELAMKMRDELQQRIDELQAENKRLRSLLPDAETRRAIKNATEFARQSDEDIIWAWLENLEGEATDG
jgi:prophage antirepressor-like protein